MITFGIISTAQIAHRFIKGATFCENVVVKAVASRDIEKAQNFAMDYEGMIAYGSYEALFQDKTITAVYIATPNFTHKDLILQALSYGKHVLVEKPMVLCEEDVRTCFAVAKKKGLVLMEAMKPCFLPTTQKAKTWINNGLIGELRYIQASYCHGERSLFTSGWHQDPNLGGGVLYDIGVYPIGFVHGMLSKQPRHITYRKRCMQDCDIFDEIQADYGNVSVHMLCACDMMMNNEALLVGTKGFIQIPDFWKSEVAYLTNAQGKQVFEDPHHRSEFRYEIQSFCDSICQHQKENAIMSEYNSLRNAQLIDQLRKGQYHE